jgi:hypothetical protein
LASSPKKKKPLQDTPADHSALVKEQLAKQQVIVLPHHPYSPDLASCDFIFFLCLKGKLRERQLQSAVEIVTSKWEALQDLSADIFK